VIKKGGKGEKGSAWEDGAGGGGERGRGGGGGGGGDGKGKEVTG